MLKLLTDMFFLLIAILLFLGGVVMVVEQVKKRKSLSDAILGTCYIIISMVIFLAWIN